VLGNDVHAFNQDTSLVRKNFQHLAGLLHILVIAGYHHYSVAFPDVELGFESVTHFYAINFFIIVYSPGVSRHPSREGYLLKELQAPGK
jgi:hypothetical protein